MLTEIILSTLAFIITLRVVKIIFSNLLTRCLHNEIINGQLLKSPNATTYALKMRIILKSEKFHLCIHCICAFLI